MSQGAILISIINKGEKKIHSYDILFTKCALGRGIISENEQHIVGSQRGE